MHNASCLAEPDKKMPHEQQQFLRDSTCRSITFAGDEVSGRCVAFVNRDKVMRLGRITVFWGIFVLLLHVGSVVAAPKSNTTEAGMEGRDIPAAGVMAEPEDSLDVIVLGDSEGHSAISPTVLWKEYGITSFVCSQSGQRAVEAYYMLKKVLSVQKPKVVILETDLFYHSREWQREWNLAIERTARYYFPIVQYQYFHGRSLLARYL